MFATVRINTPLESIEPYKSVAARNSTLSFRERVRVRASSVEREGDSGRFCRRSPSPAPWPSPRGRGNQCDASPQYEFLVCRSGPLSIPARRKWCMSSGKPGMFEGVEVELGPRQDGYYPVIKGLNPGDKDCRGGRLPDRRRNAAQPGRRLDLFWRSGGPQSGGHTDHAIGPQPAAGDQAPADKASVIRARQRRNRSQGSRLPSLRTTTSRTSSNCRRPTGSWPSRRGSCPITGAALGSMGVPVKITLRGQTVFLMLQRVHRQGKTESRRNAEETEARTRATKRDQSTQPTTSLLRTIGETHDRKNHRVLDSQPVRGHPGGPWRGDLGHPRRHQHAGRCDSRSLGEPGDRLHRLDGPQPQGDRGPDHLPALGQLAGACGRKGRAIQQRVQLLDD